MNTLKETQEEWLGEGGWAVVRERNSFHISFQGFRKSKVSHSKCAA